MILLLQSSLESQLEQYQSLDQLNDQLTNVGAIQSNDPL